MMPIGNKQSQAVPYHCRTVVMAPTIHVLHSRLLCVWESQEEEEFSTAAVKTTRLCKISAHVGRLMLGIAREPDLVSAQRVRTRQ